MGADPTASQCTAHSKSNNGERCKHRVRGGGVCHVHGGAAKQVKAAQEARAAVMEAELDAAKEGEPFERRHPGEVLLDAVMASDILLQHLLRKRAAGELTAEESTALGWAIDRASRTSKTALDAGIEERMQQVRERPTRLLVDQLTAILRGILADPRVSVVDGQASAVILDAVRKLDGGEDAGPEPNRPELLALTG
jgi:hypothetical protein